MSDSGEVSSQRHARLNLLRRQSSGQAARTRLGELFEGVPSDAWRILPLSESDALTAQVLSAVSTARQSGHLMAHLDLSRVRFENEVHRLLTSRAQHELVLVALSDVNEIGLIEVRLSALAALAPQIIDFDRDSLIATSADMSWGIVAQRVEHDDEQVEYQAEYWGL